MCFNRVFPVVSNRTKSNQNLIERNDWDKIEYLFCCECQTQSNTNRSISIGFDYRTFHQIRREFLHITSWRPSVLVSQTNPAGIKVFLYVSTFFCSQEICMSADQMSDNALWSVMWLPMKKVEGIFLESKLHGRISSDYIFCFVLFRQFVALSTRPIWRAVFCSHWVQ